MNNRLELPRCLLENADCREFLKNIPSESIELVLVDPPYGVDHLNHTWDKTSIDSKIEKSKNCTVGSIPVGMKFDPSIGKNLAEFMYPIFEEFNRILKPGGFCLVFSQPRASHRIGVALEDAGFELRDLLAWDYGAGQGKAQGMQNFISKNKDLSEEEKSDAIEMLEGWKTPQLTPTFESIWLGQKCKEGKFWENFVKHGVGLVNFKDGNKRVKFNHSKPSKQERDDAFKHPTLKPISLMEDLIKVFSSERTTVLDCFAGSATTAIACLNTNRNFIGCEIDPTYYKEATERVKKHLT